LLQVYADKKKKKIKELLQQGQHKSVNPTQDRRQKPTVISIFPELGGNDVF